MKTFSNVMLLVWRVLLGRIPTRLSLRSRGGCYNSTACALCLSAEESCQHLFVECIEVFSEGVVDAEEVLQKAQLKLWLWLKHKGHNFSYSFSDWILNPWFCICSYK